MLRSQSAADGLEPAATYSPAEDARLLSQVARGDLRAFEALYRGYHPRLTRFLSNLVRKPEVVEELVNDTLLAVWRKPEGYGGASKVSTWLFAIAYRKALKARQRLDEPVEDPDADLRQSDEAGPEQQLGQLRARHALVAAMRALSPDHRAVIDLSYFHDADYREIAEIMECPVDTVKTRMFYARRALRRELAGALSDWL